MSFLKNVIVIRGEDVVQAYVSDYQILLMFGDASVLHLLNWGFLNIGELSTNEDVVYSVSIFKVIVVIVPRFKKKNEVRNKVIWHVSISYRGQIGFDMTLRFASQKRLHSISILIEI